MKKRLILTLLAVFMFASLCIPAFAASSSHMSAEIPHNDICGYDYYTFSMLNISDNRAWSNVFLVSKDVETQQYTTVPAGYMGVEAKVFDSNREVLIHSGMIYNSSPYYFIECNSGTTYFTGNIRGGGEIAIYDGADYKIMTAPYTPYANSSSTNKIPDSTSLDKNGCYPKNSSGQTYGSCLDAEQAGGDPDLISAIGVGGVHGYIKNDDVTPKVSNPMEAMEYMVNFNSNRIIPLYDKEGVRIGSFALAAMEEEVVAGARAALAEMRAELAKGNS